MKRNWPSLLVFLAACALAATLGGIATASSVNTWHAALVKPAWNPPNAVFGPVWTVLYAMMAIVGWRLWIHRDGPGIKRMLVAYWAQLVLNASWSLLFFGLRNPAAALVDIIALWILLAWLQVHLWKHDRIGGMLWIPYLLWVSFATALNTAIWRLN